MVMGRIHVIFCMWRMWHEPLRLSSIKAPLARFIISGAAMRRWVITLLVPRGASQTHLREGAAPPGLTSALSCPLTTNVLVLLLLLYYILTG